MRKALHADDDRLLQGATTSPPPMHSMRDCILDGACVIGYCGWQGDGLETVGEVEKFFAQVCFAVDTALGEPAACRWFLNWFDDNPRREVRAQLLCEIDRILIEGPAEARSEETAAA